MPSFYPPRQLPLTPPEYNMNYHQSNGCSGMPNAQHSYAASQSMGRHEEQGYNLNYNPQVPAPAPVPSTTIHQHQSSSYQNVPGNVPMMHRWSEVAAGFTLPPVRSFNLPSHLPSQSGSEPAYQCQQDYRPHAHYEEQVARSQVKAKEEKPVGGVSATLDYNMDCMTDFVSHMALKFVQAGKSSHDGFRSWVHGVLCATRLPSATIILSLEYLSVRMTMLQATRQESADDSQIYRLLTVALILGSKFLDDNTFINRSWADVSLIEVTVLNHMELEWLRDIDFKLHRTSEETKDFEEWRKSWKEWEAQSLARSGRPLKLSPINTNLQGNVRKSFTPHSSQSALPPPSARDYSARVQPPSLYHTPSYASYDPWLIPRSSTETSPMSAPHTGPNTPDYYGGPGTWAPLDNGSYSYNARPYGFTPLSQARPQSHVLPLPQAAPFTPFTPQYQHSAWMTHQTHCGCQQCSRQHMPSFMYPNFVHAPIVAA